MGRFCTGLLPLALLGFALSGCIQVSAHSALQRIHDHQVTYEDFNDTMDIDLVGDSFPPLPVHEFDHDRVESAGGYRAIDGGAWFGAGEEERGDMLADVQDEMPAGSVMVIEVATGEVWVLPSSGAQLVADGVVTAWTEDEYDDLPDYVAEAPDFGYYGPTAYGYRQMTAIAAAGGLRPIVYVHPLVRSAVARLAAQHARSFALSPYWQYLTPRQRLALMLNLQNYVLMTAYFRTHPFLFGVSIPDGGIYAFPEVALWQLAALHAARPWTTEEILMLSATGILPAIVTLRRGEILRRQIEIVE